MKHYQPSEAFSWGKAKFDPSRLVPQDDPAVKRFPHLFIDPDTGQAVTLSDVAPKKKGPGRPRKTETSE